MKWSTVPNISEIETIVNEIILRLHTQSLLEASINHCRQLSNAEEYFNWQSESLFSGYSGMALLDAYLEACYPGHDWDVQGHQYLQLAAESLNNSYVYAVSSLTGLAFAASLLSKHGKHYTKLLSCLDPTIITLTRTHIGSVSKHLHGHPSSEIDTISGLSGTGAYLLGRIQQNECFVTLREVAACLVALCGEEDNIPHWYVPSDLIMQNHWRSRYPLGLLDSGIAHGIAGPLALLSLIRMHDQGTDGIDEAITFIVEWLCDHRCDDDCGINWSSIYPVKGIGEPAAPSRCAWCVGSPGIARAIWLAGEALNNQTYRQLAIDAMKCVYQRVAQGWQIGAPGLCHGIAGLLQITLRFMNDTNLPLFRDAAQLLVRQVASRYEPNSLLGFRDFERDTPRDRPDMLEGVIGIALCLVSVTNAQAPSWDRMLLLA